MPGRIRNLLRRVGIEAYRYLIYRSAGAHLDLLLNHSQTDLVLDVGANSGQYASGLCAHGYVGRIVSFESLAAAHASLVDAARAELVRLGCVVPASDRAASRGSGSEIVAATAAIPSEAKNVRHEVMRVAKMRIDLRTGGMWRRIGI